MDAGKNFVVYCVNVAERHVQSGSLSAGSARLAVADAKHNLVMGNLRSAVERALKSLEYSVGVFSPVYQEAWREYLRDWWN